MSKPCPRSPLISWRGGRRQVEQSGRRMQLTMLRAGIHPVTRQCLPSAVPESRWGTSIHRPDYSWPAPHPPVVAGSSQGLEPLSRPVHGSGQSASDRQAAVLSRLRAREDPAVASGGTAQPMSAPSARGCKRQARTPPAVSRQQVIAAGFGGGLCVTR